MGTGLIGSSLGIGLRNSGWTVRGWDPDQRAIEGAMRVGALDSSASSLEGAVEGSELVVLAGPVRGILDNLAVLSTEALVTDVGGVKKPVIDAASRLPRFVGGHPMAGRETSGPSGASGSLFRGATWVLVSDRAAEEDLARMKAVVDELGAIPVVMSAEEHDTAVAAASHVPHLVASALVAVVTDDPGARALAAGGFRDLTRVSMSDPAWWIDVLLANREPVVETARRLTDHLESLTAAISAEDSSELDSLLSESRTARMAMAPPVASVSIVVEDRPGEIARVGHSLSESGVDLRDLQLRHATHGGGGVLTLLVRAGEEDKLRAALRADGFQVLGGSEG